MASDALDWVLDHLPHIVVGAMIAAFLSFVGFSFVWVNHDETVQCTVTEKTASQGDQSTDYRVYTEECGVLQVKDELLLGKFNSADRFGQIKVEGVYEFDTVGWRFPFLSMFPNIVEVR